MVVPETPLEYHFLDTSFEGLYQSEIRLGRILVGSIIFAILISCFGLFALSSFAVERRRKEIGIRKVLGASTIRIAGMLLREFILLVLMAALLACPVTYSVMNRWLAGFAYRADIGAVPFVSSILLVLVVVVTTVGTHVVIAATRNPVDSLRYE